MDDRWKTTLGAWPDGDAVRFRVWAPRARMVDLVVESESEHRELPMSPTANGHFEARIEGLPEGTLYRYRIDGNGPFPDPASRRQPEGVHGPSAVVDPTAFGWTDAEWVGPDPESVVFYELHVGAFTAEGTFAAAASRLPDLVDLGVTAVELMPVAEFPGQRNWGYDSAAMFAPSGAYGAPDDLRRFVDRAHRIGLSVVLDVVYNHFGPDGSYAFAFSPDYASPKKSAWGTGLNFDGPGSDGVRRFFIENARMWLHEYHVDGLRIDAVFAIEDRGPRHFVAELTDALRASSEDVGRRFLVVAEDHRNLSRVARPEDAGGWGCDMIWSDDFHHEIRRALAGDRDGYFSDFNGTVEEIAATIEGGWYFRGQHAPFFRRPRGTDPRLLDLPQFVFFIQNHDQIGNRAFGDRLNHTIDAATYRMASALLLLAPETPLIFMGQEWSASSPFQYFTDHSPALGRKVSAGRRREFARFRAFRDPESRTRIPDPQSQETFDRSKLAWAERDEPFHRGVFELYRNLLDLRRRRTALADRGRDSCTIEPAGNRFLLLSRTSPDGDRLLAVFCFAGRGRLRLDDTRIGVGDRGSWTPVLTTEDPRFVTDPQPPEIGAGSIRFARPGAVVLEPARGGRPSETRLPVATYRVQMRQGFDLAAARDLVPYLGRLGASHVYASPLTLARAGSTHGYDVCDPNRLDPELGSRDDLAAVVETLHARGMGLVVDFVPNHMAADETRNAWWRSVLEHGPASPYGRFFDIDWTTSDEELRGRVLLPILDGRLKDLIRKGEFRVEPDGEAMTLVYGDRRLPVNDAGRKAMLGAGERHASDPEVITALLAMQHYRLAHWRAALRRINYRRFFYIDDLVALRMERAEVFDATHRLLLDWTERGWIDGLRLDHVDGLQDPAGYLWRLREVTKARDPYVVVEKILEPDERLPADWPVDGTTGYDFLNEANGLFVEGSNADRVRTTYAEFTGQTADFVQVAYASKGLIVDRYMAGELRALGLELSRALHKPGPSPTSAELREALREIVARFPVYRTYAQGESLGPEDRRWIRTAVARAARATIPARRAIFGTIRRALLDARREGETVRAFRRRVRFRTRLQQYTSAVEAKGIEDTAFYRYVPLASLNEVGGNPDRFGCSTADFHEANRRRRAETPRTMLATSTHDTKRGEDVRARIDVLSELDGEWADCLREWARLNARSRRRLHGTTLPEPLTEYHLYQTLLGSWPPGETRPTAEYVARVSDYMVKAAREAKVRTSWIRPVPRYERALVRFIDRILTGPGSGAFLDRFLPFQQKVARLGVTNSLAQVVLKVASPGVTDVYQGTELWDLHLVDPDNRQRVDFDARRKLVSGLNPMLESIEQGEEVAEAVGNMLSTWEDGRIKLFVLAAGLRLRRRHPDLFIAGDYAPLPVEGPMAEHVVAFARSLGNQRAMALVPRLTSAKLGNRAWPVGRDFWKETSVRLPERFRARNVFTGTVPQAGDRTLAVSDALAVLPVGLFLNAD